MPRLRWAAGILACLALTACGGAREFGDRVDCAQTGPAATRSDPAGDAGAKRADLVEAALARGGGKLCATFRVRADIEAPTAYALTLTPAGDPPAQLEVVVLGGTDPRVRLRTAEGVRDVDAEVGGKGAELWLRTDDPVSGPLRWQAQAVVPGQRRDVTAETPSR
jgi:hypothetical protein